MLRIFLLILLVAVFGFGAIISIYNSQPTRFSYLLGEIELPLIVLIAGSIACGVLLSLILMALRFWSLKRELALLRKQVQAQELELKRLRALQAPPPPAAPLVLPPPVVPV